MGLFCFSLFSLEHIEMGGRQAVLEEQTAKKDKIIAENNELKDTLMTNKLYVYCNSETWPIEETWTVNLVSMEVQFVK